jgi:hypothetical protein
MDIRHFITAIESYLAVLDYGVQEMDAVEYSAKSRNVIQESTLMPTSKVYSGWIDCFGIEIKDEDVLVEGIVHGTPTIMVDATDEEFTASWDYLPCQQPLETLQRLMEDMKEFDAYFLGSRIYPTRQQAVAAVSSMVRNFSDL